MSSSFHYFANSLKFLSSHKTHLYPIHKHFHAQTNIKLIEREMRWIKSLHCNSNSLDDVVFNNRRRHHNHDHSLPSCKSTVQNLKDIVQTNKHAKPKNNKPNSQKPSKMPIYKIPVSRKPEPGPTRIRPGSSEPIFPSLTELPQDHPSRNVVEIIFHTSWGEKNFPGRVEMVFKVQNPTRTITRFEEYREAVKLHASFGAMWEGVEDHARCVADGNEVMRFYCLGSTAISGAWGFKGGKGAVVSMFSGSGVAHAKAGGGRVMMVCRVIAGRVCKKLGLDSVVDNGRVGYDSVGGENGELVVFDSRALLPCFLIIYDL